MAKYYAVLVGRNPGIYMTWKEAESQIKGFPKAVFKSFIKKSDAEAFMNIDMVEREIEYPVLDYYVAFTDGSYTSRGLPGYGIVIIESNGNVHDYYGKCHTKHSSNNVAELTAILGALKLVNGNLIIYADSKYSINASKLPLSPGAANYDLISEIKKYIALREQNFKIEIHHVYGHKGQEMNERADQLAKMGAK